MLPKNLFAMTMPELKSKANIKTVKVWETAFGVPYQGWIGWRYYEGTNNIVLYDDGNNYKYPVENTKDFLTNHEIGHFFWDKYMDQKSKDMYTKRYEISKKSKTPSIYMEYWKTNVKEWFADDFAIWILWIDNWNRNQASRAKYTQLLLKRTPFK